METFEKLTFQSLRGAKRRGNLVDYQCVVRLLRPAMSGTRNDNIGVLQKSQMPNAKCQVIDVK